MFCTSESDEQSVHVYLFPAQSRGLDTYIPTLSRLEAQGDAASVAIIKQNHEEEIGHVRAARVWMEALCGERA